MPIGTDTIYELNNAKEAVFVFETKGSHPKIRIEILTSKGITNQWSSVEAALSDVIDILFTHRESEVELIEIYPIPRTRWETPPGGGSE